MKISLSSQQSSSLNFNYSYDNNKIQNSNAANKNNTSPLGGNKKINKLVDALMKQKQNLLDGKNALVDRALKNGENPSTLKDKLDSIESQIKDIEGQINQIQLEDQRKALGTDDKAKKTRKTDENHASSIAKKTQETFNEMDSLLNIGEKLAKVQKLTSINKSMDGEKRILKSEINKDIERGLNPVRKKDRVSQINELTVNINDKIGEHLAAIDSEIKTNGNGNTSNKKNKNNSNTALPLNQNLSQNIKRYSENLPENIKEDGAKVDINA